jgi:hypothetical protein
VQPCDRVAALVLFRFDERIDGLIQQWRAVSTVRCVVNRVNDARLEMLRRLIPQRRNVAGMACEDEVVESAASHQAADDGHLVADESAAILQESDDLRTWKDVESQPQSPFPIVANGKERWFRSCSDEWISPGSARCFFADCRGFVEQEVDIEKRRRQTKHRRDVSHAGCLAGEFMRWGGF